METNKLNSGDLCIFWDNAKSGAIITILSHIKNDDIYRYHTVIGGKWLNCIKFESKEQYELLLGQY